jgi:8-oxo-dGTP pyrophosphatase MutT (NUDIX family)
VGKNNIRSSEHETCRNRRHGNGQGEILCALRSPQMSLPNLWEIPGGKIDPGETPHETLVR